MFHLDELIDKEVCVELSTGGVITGLCDGMNGSYWVLRGADNDPMLVHERFVVTVFTKPKEE